MREELGRELLDAGESKAFAVADHQVAHVYVNDRVASWTRSGGCSKRRRASSACSTRRASASGTSTTPRSGELVAVAEPDAWFTYYYWLDDARAPDFARTVDIHRKPGYDPAELFIDPALRSPKLKIAATLAKRKLGFRSLMEVIPLDAHAGERLARAPAGRPERRAAGDDPAEGSAAGSRCGRPTCST